MYPDIKKANHIFGSNLFLRNVDEEDASFILKLRMDPARSKFLSDTSFKLSDQINWIREYKNKQDQAYFIICDNQANRLGCIRMYDSIQRSYCWGSWIIINGLSPLVSIESALLIFAYGKSLGFEDVRIDVRQINKTVWNFHEKFFFAELVRQTQLDRFYVVRIENINMLLAKYSTLVPQPLQVDQYLVP